MGVWVGVGGCVCGCGWLCVGVCGCVWMGEWVDEEWQLRCGSALLGADNLGDSSTRDSVD